jgi:putative transposase
MIKPKHPELSLSRQCSLLGISRSSVYYNQQPVKAEDLELMNIIDKQYLKTPFYGSRSMTKHLKREGHAVNRKRIQRLMRLMGLEAVYPRPRTSIPYSGHTVYPYLLRGMSIERPNQVWAADITYIPLKRGFMYLVAIMDWNSRKVLAWRVSNTMESGFCVEALQEAIERYGFPEIFNTDQGSQFTSHAFTGLLQENGIKISMDGRGRFHDNIFIERLWWTVKYQYLYLRTFDNGAELRKGLKKWFSFYNGERPHQSLNDLTPDEVYCKNLKPIREAA